MNSANYYLTQNGVINKLDTYWDALQGITLKLENLSRELIKRLFHYYSGSFVFIIVIFWINFEKHLALIPLSFLSVGSVSLVIMQIFYFLDFLKTRKKGVILHNELSNEIEKNYDDLLDEEVSIEERILLSNFILASEMPINAYLYLFLLGMLPVINISFMVFYYLY